MNFEWDEVKRQVNVAKHRVDFRVVEELLDGRPVVTVPSTHSQELRFLTTGMLDGKFYTVVWTHRNEAVRVISARRARDAEEREYRSLHR